MTAREGAPGDSGEVQDFDAARRLFAVIHAEDVTSEPGMPSIPGYAVERHLGSGGGGEVFLASREGSEHAVVVKIVHRRFGDVTQNDRVWRELHVMAQLHLDCVPRLVDFGEVDARLYLATDHVEGRSITEYSCGLDLRERVEILARVADAVHSLHEYGVIHRDLKPEHFIINTHGQPMIIDLGIAVLLSDDVTETITADGVLVGTPAYMSPEQARGERTRISTRSDVFGLGATAYRVLTGEPPHDVNVTLHEAVRRVAQDEPRDPRDIEPSLPKSLAAVLRQAVSRSPDDRYASAAALAEDLRRWLRGDPPHASGVPRLIRVGRILRRHPIVATTALCTGIAAIAIVLTMISILYLRSVPHDLRLSQDQSEAQLLSIGGAVLRTWDTDAKDGIEAMHFLERPTELGGGKVAIIAFNPLHQNNYEGGLHFYPLDRSLEHAGQIRRIEPEDVPPELNSRLGAGDSFYVSKVFALDVFDENPGPELVAFHQHGQFSACAVCIYSLAGERLYLAWHDGNLVSAHWLSGPRLLLVAGLNGEAFWPERGVTDMVSGRHPLVVLAMNPRMEPVAPLWIRAVEERTTTEVVWYQCVWPAVASDIFGNITLSAPMPGVDATRIARLNLFVRDPEEAGIAWQIDHLGREVPDTRVPSNRYRNDPTLQDLPPFELRDLPPIQ